MIPRDNPAVRWSEPVVQFAAIVSGYAVLGLSFLVGVEVVIRKLFSASIQGVDEIGGYVAALMVSFGFTYALILKGHTRIDVFFRRFPPKMQAIMNVLALLTTSGFAGFMVWRAIATLAESIELKSVATTPLRTPLWLPQSLWVAGLVLFAGVSAALALHALWLTTRNPRHVNEEYGPPTLEEEIESERVEMAGLDDDRADRGDRSSGRT